MMAKKGDLKAPIQALDAAFEHAMSEITFAGEDVALFMVGGALRATRRSSSAFEKNMERLAGGLIGVYNLAVDAADVKKDIAEFYRGAN